jgi:hypothetical protein
MGERGRGLVIGFENFRKMIQTIEFKFEFELQQPKEMH